MFSLTHICFFATVLLSAAVAEEATVPVTPTPVSTAEANVLPEKFYGYFEHDHDSDFNEYLYEKNYMYLARKTIHWRTYITIFMETDVKTEFTFAQSAWKTFLPVVYKNITFGKTINGTGYDYRRQITFTLKDGHLFEHRVPLKGLDAQEETFEYFFEGEFLVRRAFANGVVGRRFYKRIPVPVPEED